MTEPLYISFLWHMHQPYYKAPDSGEYVLPWTYLHAVKDYYDMAAIVDETPGARVVFNLVPSLLEQLLDYAAGTAQDPFLVKGGMSPADMGEEERLFVIENFFSANRQRMIEPSRRYLELLQLADGGKKEKKGKKSRIFRDQDILDLQVLFFLSWTGEAARRRHPEIRQLVLKGKNYTPADKELLFAKHREILSAIIPLYRKLHDEGKAELAVSPYFHPILPLLCDTGIARTAMQKVNLPSRRFVHPGDARGQVAAALDYFEKIFGFRPAGMWPSEGSISDETLEIIAECGLKWVASDEEVLLRSLTEGFGPGKESLYHPYSFRDKKAGLRLFFRDHGISDQIGFTYSQWEPLRAVNDFLAKIGAIRKNAPKSRVVSVILDGENAWEYYPENGYGFLKLLYESIADTGGLAPATFSELLPKVPVRRALQHVHPGSWINGDYGIWIGHPEENLAWDMLGAAREAAVESRPEIAPLLAGQEVDANPDATLTQICSSIRAAEGSDWFWWYGDDHFSPTSDRFDLLFRRHLINVYRLLKLEIPPILFEPIKKEFVSGLVREPADLITPVIDGMASSYFEWLAAGLFDLTRQFSAMHAAQSLMHSFYYGYDTDFFYFRIDGDKPLDRLLQTGDALHLYLNLKNEFLLTMRPDKDRGGLLVRDKDLWKSCGHECSWKLSRICEARVPLKALAPNPGDDFFSFIVLVRNGEEIGRWPADSAMTLKYAGPQLGSDSWLI